MTLEEYVRKRNGVAVGSRKSLRNNLYRSIGAKNFSAFWTYWNPIFGYYLGTKVFKPLKRVLPASLALLFTFLVCGLIHDLVTTIVRGGASFFFTIWFFLMSLCVLSVKFFTYDLSQKQWFVRAVANLCFVIGCFFLTACLSKIFNF
jgi:cbb3-type cytochrome oxidase subunit 3